MYITLIVLFLSAIFFMSGKVRSDLVALCALVLLIIFGILTPEEALTGFSNSVVTFQRHVGVLGGGCAYHDALLSGSGTAGRRCGGDDSGDEAIV